MTLIWAGFIIRKNESKKQQNSGHTSIGFIPYAFFIDMKGRWKNESIQERDRVKISDIIHLNPGEFYGINAEGKPREFIKTQFIQNRINSFENQNVIVSDKEMSDNYFRIIEESKGLI